ncbi:MAG: alpha/beta fold hydrolase [Acidiferrobacterales bacterium]
MLQSMEQEKIFEVTPGISIRYRVSEPTTITPTTPSLILIHGVASNLTRWTEFLTKTLLKSRCRILRLDLRGHAGSQTNIAVGMENWCKDLIAILDEEGIDRAYIVGHSLGAQVALNLATRFPNRVAGMVLIDPIVPSALKGYLAIGPYIRWLFGGFSYLAGLWRRIFFPTHRFPLRDLYVLDQQTRKLIAEDPTANLAELYHSPSADMQFISLSNYLRDMYEVIRPLPRLADITMPTLALLARDPSVSDAGQNRLVMQQMPNITMETIDADHWPLTERPDETREAIERWCLSKFD